MFIAVIFQSLDTNCGGKSELVCREKLGRVVNTNLCLFPDYNKFELPIKNGVNIIDIGIDITDVLRINDKASYNALSPLSCLSETSFTSTNVKLRLRFDIPLTFT